MRRLNTHVIAQLVILPCEYSAARGSNPSWFIIFWYDMPKTLPKTSQWTKLLETMMVDCCVNRKAQDGCGLLLLEPHGWSCGAWTPIPVMKREFLDAWWQDSMPRGVGLLRSACNLDHLEIVQNLRPQKEMDKKTMSVLKTHGWLLPGISGHVHVNITKCDGIVKTVRGGRVGQSDMEFTFAQQEGFLRGTRSQTAELVVREGSKPDSLWLFLQEEAIFCTKVVKFV